MPGLEWEQMLLVGADGIPVLGEMRGWRRNTGEAGPPFREPEAMAIRATRRWGDQVLHLFDCGSASGHWLWRWGRRKTRFVVRWKKGNKRLDAAGEECKVWKIARRKRCWGQRKLRWDRHARTVRETGVLALPARHAEYPGNLFLVVVRQGKGREPWDVLTNEPAERVKQAWEIVEVSASRWKIEEPFRFDKCAWQIDPFRLRDEEAHHRLLMLVTLAARLLLAARRRLFPHWCQRSDWRLERVRILLA